MILKNEMRFRVRGKGGAIRIKVYLEGCIWGVDKTDGGE